MTRPNSPCFLPPQRYAIDLAHEKISRCFCLIAAYVGFPGAAVRFK